MSQMFVAFFLVTGFYVQDLAGLLTRPYPFIALFPSHASPLGIKGDGTVVQRGQFHQGGTQQRRLSGIPTRFPFHPGPQPQAPNHAAKIQKILTT